MFRPRLGLLLLVFAAVVSATNMAWALGFELGETKEQLGLKYIASVTDHKTGRITFVLKLGDEGRLKPLNSVDLVVSSKDGTGYVDLSVGLEPRDENGLQVVRVHVHKDFVDRAQIQLRTSHLDGKQQVATWYYHVIPIKKYIKDGEKKERD